MFEMAKIAEVLWYMLCVDKSDNVMFVYYEVCTVVDGNYSFVLNIYNKAEQSANRQRSWQYRSV